MSDIQEHKTTAQLVHELGAVELEIIEAGGEVTDERLARFEAAASALASKADACAFYVAEQEAKAEAARELAKRAQARAKALDNSVERFKRHLLAIMGERKFIEGEGVRMVRVKNQPSVEVLNLQGVMRSGPDLVTRTVAPPDEVTIMGGVAYYVKADKAAIKRALLAGREVIGARLVEGGERLDIK